MFARDPNKNTNQPRDQKVKVPTLLMMGVHDSFLSQALDEGNEKFVENILVRNIDGSHWLQQDCPDEVNREMRDLLGN